MHFSAVYRLRRYLWRSAARGRRTRKGWVKSTVFYL